MAVEPTERELQILKILWAKGQGTVREVYEEMSKTLPIVQNTVQAFLRTMEEKASWSPLCARCRRAMSGCGIAIKLAPYIKGRGDSIRRFGSM